MPTNAETRPKGAPALDPSLLAVASLASVCSAVVASAIGTGPVATLVVAAVSPWIVAFISYPGRRRHRRVGAVLLLAGLVHGARAGMARAASYIRHPRDRGRRRARERATDRSPVGHGVPRRLSRVAATTIGAVGVAGVCLTVPELVLGAAVVADRPLTLLPVAAHRVDGPGTHPNTPGAGRRPGPTLSVPGGGVRRLATSQRGARVTYPVVARDARGAALTPECHPASGRLFPMGETRVTCTATQANGLHASGDFVVTVVSVMRKDGPPADAEPPRLSTPKALVRETGSGPVRVTFAVSALDATDGLLTPSCWPASGSLFVVGSTLVTCAATDATGNTGVAKFAVTVRLAAPAAGADRTPPDLSLPRSVRAVARTPLGAVVDYIARAVDVRDGSVHVTCAPRSGSRFPVGRTEVHCTAKDGAGNQARGAFAVRVELAAPPPDRTAPRIALPRSVRERATSSAGAVVRYRASATDDRDGWLPVTCRPASGSMFPIGGTTVTCRAIDHARNVATRSLRVFVDAANEPNPPADTKPDPSPGRDDPPRPGSDPSPKPNVDRIAPEIGDFEIPAVTAETMKGAVVSYTAPTAVDDRDGRVPVHCTPESGSWLRVGETTITCKATDSAGNEAQRTGVARVLEPDLPPQIDSFRIPVAYARTNEGAIVRYDEPRAIDDHDGPVRVDCKPPSGDLFRVGSTTVTCTAQDSSGHTASRTATAVVEPPPDAESGSAATS